MCIYFFLFIFQTKKEKTQKPKKDVQERFKESRPKVGQAHT
jgi:hypothetical protein